MREAETVLNIIRKRGKQNLTLSQVYRQLYNPNLYLQSYGRISTNSGAMTKGVIQKLQLTKGLSMAISGLVYLTIMLKKDRSSICEEIKLSIEPRECTNQIIAFYANTNLNTEDMCNIIG